MEIILIRHTTPKVKKGICYGQSDIDTEESFEKEVLVIQSQLQKINNNIFFYSSPLKRCRKLAEKLSKKIRFDDRLKELNFGDWELKKWDDIDKKILDIWMNDFVNIPPKNGESYIELFHRTSTFIKELKEEGIQKAVIVTHAGVIRSLHAFINETLLEDSFKLKIPYGAVIKLSF